jgi:4-amino-4-deoxy-L-arabinose transferase-like glycosyltransferase
MTESTYSSSDVQAANARGHGMRTIGARILEVVILLAVCYFIFVSGSNRYRFIQTEALRAIVVSEMLERDGYSMPTIHHRPYLRKPPLYAWMTTGLARGVGMFDERIARLPSNLSAVAFVLLLYFAGEWWVGRHAGLVAAALAIANVTVIDYGMRAELDMGFTFCTTLSMLLVWPALHKRRVVSFLAWMGVYLGALAGAMYKGPHSLIFLWLMLLAYAYGKGQLRRLMSPGNIVGLTATLGVLVAWTVTLSAYAGAKLVGKSAGVEVVERLVPYKPGDWLSVLTFPPLLFCMLVPASLLIAASVFQGRGEAEAGGGLAQSILSLLPRSVRKGDLRDYFRAIGRGAPAWWKAMAADPFAEFLLYWLLPNIVFMVIVPAKSSRYTLPIFAPTFLLAAYIMCQYGLGQVNGDTRTRIRYTWRAIFAVVLLGGLAAFGMGLVVAQKPSILGQGVALHPTQAWWITGLGLAAIGAAGLLRFVELFPQGRWLGLLLVPLAIRPVLMEVWWPLRVASDSQIPVMTAIDEMVPAGEPVIVLGNNEMSDLAFYSSHHYYWLNEPTEAAGLTRGDSAFVLIPTKVYDEWEARYPGRFTKVRHFERKERGMAVELARFELKRGG